MSPIRVRALLQHVLSSACIACASCIYVDDHDDDGYVSPPFDTWEIEPNDDAWNPDVIGPLGVGDGLIIGGHVTELGPDLYDGFAFQSLSPCDIEFTLVAQEPFADLDLCVYDPLLGYYSFCFEGGTHVEKGVFSVPFGFTDFHLVVFAYDGPSEYRLEVRCRPITLFAAARAGAPAGCGADEHRGYYERPAADPQSHVAARGVLLEIDPATGAVARRAFEVRAAWE